MFRPNAIGALRRVVGRDVQNRETLGPEIECPFAPVKLSRDVERTTVRADSSATRGQADEVVSASKILVVAYVQPRLGDRFIYNGQTWKISAVHPRTSVAGVLDHYECDMDALPA